MITILTPEGVFFATTRFVDHRILMKGEGFELRQFNFSLTSFLPLHSAPL